MIDSHCHLNFDILKKDFTNIILRSEESGISKILTINTNPNDFDSHIDLIKDNKNIFISYGIHPQDVVQETIFSFDDLEKKMKYSQLVGLGETGLDFYHSDKHKMKQIEIFELHIEASIKYNLPIIVHQRNS